VFRYEICSDLKFVPIQNLFKFEICFNSKFVPIQKKFQFENCSNFKFVQINILLVTRDQYENHTYIPNARNSANAGNSYTPTRSAVIARRTPSARGMGRPGRPIFVYFLCFCFFIHFYFSFLYVFSFTALYYDFEFYSVTKKLFKKISDFKNYILKLVRILKFVHISKIV
jgi:hypothetical protein